MTVRVLRITHKCQTIFSSIHVEWLPMAKKEDILKIDNPDGFLIYAAEKVLSERAVWEFAEQHPDIELTTGAQSIRFFTQYRS